MSRRISTGATFKWLGAELLADLLDYCTCYHDTSPTFVIRKAVVAYIAAELSDKEKRKAFDIARKARLGLGATDNVTAIRPGGPKPS